VPVLKKIQTTSSEICLWKITEKEDDFDLAITTSKSDLTQRNTQWLASRAALDALEIDISNVVKDDNGKPYVKGKGKHISISHAKQYAAAISSRVAVGIDIEEITPRIERIAVRFVNDAEWAFVKEKSKLETLYLLWSAKEALYKLYGKKAVDFKKHMIASPFETKKQGWFEMTFYKESERKFIMQYEIYDNHTFVWVEGD
jgi:4'-phosphopantetheinyl transferase